MSEYRGDADGNIFHKSAIINPRAKIGKNNLFGPYCTVYHNVTIGNDNKFISHVSVGTPGEHKKLEDFSMKLGKVVIGNHNTFREFITINKSTKEESITLIEDDCYIMRGGHISHDTWVESGVIMSCDVILGGHSRIMRGTYMGIKSCTHPFTIIGAFCIAGMGAVITKDFAPGLKLVGIPANERGTNVIGLERANLNPGELDLEVQRFCEALKRRDV